MKTTFLNYVLSLATLFLLCRCGSKPAPAGEEEAVTAAVTPVTTDTLSTGPMTEYLELNGISSYLKKNSVKSSVSGYISQILINIGDNVKRDQDLFTIKTKEASALDNSHSGADSLFRFAGLIHIRSFQDGVISSLNRHAGDYVQDGDELCIVSDKSSFAFLLDVPFELHQYIKEGGQCDIVLPDKEVIPGVIRSNLPSMDLNSQTESYIVKPETSITLPENLIARIRIIKNKKDKALSLPRSAVLANETQTEFWVMKLLNDSTAVKIPIKKGIETQDRVEIAEPVFSGTDKFLISGNYGLDDTAKVIVNKGQKQE